MFDRLQFVVYVKLRCHSYELENINKGDQRFYRERKKVFVFLIKERIGYIDYQNGHQDD